MSLYLQSDVKTKNEHLYKMVRINIFTSNYILLTILQGLNMPKLSVNMPKKVTK